MKQSQVDFIIDNFFKPSLSYNAGAGWRGISEKLIREGQVITTIHAKDMFEPLIGNFIGIKDAGDGYVDCIKMSFDVDSYITSLHFKETYEYLIEKREKEVMAICNEFDELKELAR